MSRNENTEQFLEQRDAFAFEYVSGALRGEERQAFEELLRENKPLQDTVQFWEEQLMTLQPKASDIKPMPNSDAVWEKIHERINPPSEKPNFLTKYLWQWLTPAITAAVFAFALLIYIPTSTERGPNTDYVAVLTDETGQALLTALTIEEHQKMWLKWELTSLRQNRSAQLWAVSRRDGETRPIAVLDTTNTRELALEEAEWRLVTDAEYLVLTEEEPGGSAIDEPSDILLARGFCVRLTAS